MKKSLVDTNILLRLILHDNSRLFTKARAIVERATKTTLVVSPVVTAEVLYVLRIKGYGRLWSVDVLLMLINRPQFGRSELLTDSLRYYAETKLDFADCYLLARALRSNTGLLTLDNSLQKIYNRLKPASSQAS